MNELKIHPVTACYPMMAADEMAELVEDIRAKGLLFPVTVMGDVLLDGRNRLEACGRAGVAVKTVEYDGDDPAGFIITTNKRRNLTVSQRAAVANRIATLKDGQRADRVAAQDCAAGITQEEAARIMGISRRSVQQAREIELASPELEQEVLDGEKTLGQAAREIKETKRETRRQENAKVARAAPDPVAAGGVYATIMIDPPWDWGDEGDVDQMGRAKPDYATMSLEQIAALEVGKLADRDAHLYLWITNRSLPKGFALLEGWGFRYITALTWPKPSFGMGNYFRGQTEHILFGVRGAQQLKRKDASTLLPGWRRGPGGHSSKPTEIHEFIESCSPGPYLEMFARNVREGWQRWGADA